MADLTITNSLTSIHFPQRIKLIMNLRYISFWINDVVLICSGIIFAAWVINTPVLNDILFKMLGVVPSPSILFILSGIPLLFGARRHLEGNEATKSIHYPWWNVWIPIFFATVTALLGLFSFLPIHVLSLFSGFRVPSVAGFGFFLIGLALIPPFTQIPHRFHITQLFIFIVSGMSMLVVFESLFEVLFSFSSSQGNPQLFPLSLGLTFAFFCFGVLLRWSNRGFFGNFTLDSTGSKFGFRVFLINLVVSPLVVLFAFISFQSKKYSFYEMLGMIVVLFSFISSLLIWINVKLLYKYELEHLLMRESLRVHNIDLTKEQETLKKKMTAVEQEKQQYKSQLTVQSGWKNAVDNSA